MKKIKYLLGIGLFGALFSSCFGLESSFMAVEYFGFDSDYSNYIFSFNDQFKFMSANSGSFESIDSFLWSGNMSLSDSLLNNSSYDILTNYYYGGTPYTFHVYSFFDINNGGVSLLYKANQYYGTYLIPISDGVSSTSSQISNSNGLYFRVKTLDGDGTVSNNPFSSTGYVPVSSRTWVFFTGFVYDSLRGQINDTLSNGVVFQRGVVVPGVSDEYSFTKSLDYYSSGSSYAVSGFFNNYFFKTIQPTFSGSYSSYYGVFITKLNNLYKRIDTTTGYKILAISLTGCDSTTLSCDFVFSIYNCTSSSTSYSDCLFDKGGYLKPSLTNSFDSYNGNLFSTVAGSDPLSNFLFFLGLPNYLEDKSQYLSPTIYNVEGINSITFYRPSAFKVGEYDYSTTFSLNQYTVALDSSVDIDILGSISGGNGNQSTGSIAINTGLLNLCLNDLQFGELNSYLCNQLLSNLGNPVQIPGTSGQYISVSIDENGNLRYWITTQEDLAEQMSGFVWVENEDGTRSTICPSGNCLGTILAQPINHGDGNVFELTTGDVLDMMSNLTGWVGRCPFPYTDFRLGKNLKLLQLLQDYGFNYDPFIIINCSVAGFQYGRHTIDNTLFGDTFEHPLLYGDTSKHRSLFVFLDFVVILGLFGLFAFIKRIF